MFVGDFERSVDANGRLTLPSKFRDKLDGTACYLTRDVRGCLLITPRADFDEESRITIERVNRGELPVTAKQQLGGNSVDITVDKQGRFTIDELHRGHAGIRLSGSIRLIGALNTIELWRPSRYTVVEAEKAPEARVRDWGDENDD